MRATHNELMEKLKAQLMLETWTQNFGINVREKGAQAAKISKSHMYKIWAGQKNLTEKRALIWADSLGYGIDWVNWILVKKNETDNKSY